MIWRIEGLKIKKMAKSTEIYGIRTTIEAIKSGKILNKVLIKKGLRSTIFSELFDLVKKYEIPYQYVPIEKLNRITNANHQGIVADVSVIEYQKIENVLPAIYENGKTPLILILDKISDVRNFGAIVRTAECAGVDAIIIPTFGSARISADAIKTSAGALFSVPICRSFNLKETIVFLKNSGLQIVAASEKSSNYYYTINFTLPTTIISGSEEKGVSNEYLKLSDIKVRIPQFGKIDSLNVSIASGVIIYEAIRQRMIGSVV
ncbi:MAG: 23S rRNA (guanosine(2251)-2'-O)-methyltransferase RlmB [Bacteroidetes bacterium]|jgi:23S rRNA (guanosine2251-2'-O)-methyltransferase|nr:23S rRNA (guanosine(2251)-2'-O)-methyltransferase RlmB [Bacteroidota bacterium]MBT6686901.1 23S rRNA (guanosine(2251)-2'-O)-methyltransferase RlmB [Bacteroidota bacterium]MBT7144201.1 23S rRNA (guanosine(2251)-2'-O)-methyltransferase RlmB [Bacteroidota bacterium]MBT7491584.1 23S rRNA (guanosine(2251)-2'-O)-methyltransferase RlmB [Bacteroidota bacterium]